MMFINCLLIIWNIFGIQNDSYIQFTKVVFPFWMKKIIGKKYLRR